MRHGSVRISMRSGILVGTLAALLSMNPANAGEITDKKTCNSETDRLIDLYLTTEPPSDISARLDELIRDAQYFCHNGSYEAAQLELDEAKRLLKGK